MSEISTRGGCREEFAARIAGLPRPLDAESPRDMGHGTSKDLGPRCEHAARPKRADDEGATARQRSAGEPKTGARLVRSGMY